MHVLAIDAGTTSTRALIFDAQGGVVAVAQREFAQHFPADGWVEHDAEEIWTATLAVCRDAIAKAGIAAAGLAGIGITNQRETTVVWERTSGRPIHRAIVWQDRRTAGRCRELASSAVLIQQRTGLVLDAYFSATKIAWILDAVPGARLRAENGELAFGTIDSWLLWKLTDGRVHATDATNASRTMLYAIGPGRWDDELCRLFAVPPAMLPAVRDCAADYGVSAPALLGSGVPIRGMAGDQQAAALGQACTHPGATKATYGTGCFVLAHAGTSVPVSRHRLLATVAWQLDGRRSYALEGAIFNAGTAVQWLRDKLGIISDARETEALAASLPDNRGVHLVPAFTGLGAPWWRPDVRAALVGMTRDTGRAELARAALESVAYQTCDLLRAMNDDGVRVAVLRVDGGMTANGWLMQCIADLLGAPVERPALTETTAWGAAWLAGMHAGLYPGIDGLASLRRVDRVFTPTMAGEERERLQRAWLAAVRRQIAG
ncbi:MAG: glycerol kinase GlpK [Planctomycetes bacterium]|nr:glycerol kinase GlpK [Planctomycetota bacterium]